MANTKNKVLDKNQIAALMGCKPKSAISRLVALGYTKVCERCGGCGRYSWNQINGDVCFGCGGVGKVMGRITAEVVAEAMARIENGELVTYFAENKARREIKAANDALWADYKVSAIAVAYEAAYKAMSKLGSERARAGLEPYGDGNNCSESPAGRAQQLQNRLMDRAQAAMYDKKATHAARIAVIREVHAMILELNRVFAQP